jgi:hypothetical protein
MQQPLGYQELQYKWCVGRGDEVQASAAGRVQNATEIVRRLGLSKSGVLVIGPQHGFELQEYQDLGFAPVVGLEVVESFCQDGRALGFEVYQGDCEHLASVVPGRWNIHASHILEHCYDQQEAVRQITQACDEWCFVGVPIEPTGGSDGHCHPIRSHEHLKSLFPAPTWLEVHYEFLPTKSGRPDRYGTVEAMWVRRR